MSRLTAELTLEDPPAPGAAIEFAQMTEKPHCGPGTEPAGAGLTAHHPQHPSSRTDKEKSCSAQSPARLAP